MVLKTFSFFSPFLKASYDFSCIILKKYCHDELARCTNHLYKRPMEYKTQNILEMNCEMLQVTAVYLI